MNRNEIDILALSGSLRAGSFNSKLLELARSLAPAGAAVEIYDYRDVPVYDEDIEQSAFPEPVRRLKERIRRADALLIATPEFNFAIPGVLKNALDWASRPYGDNVFAGKPLAIFGGAAGQQGGTRAQDQVRHIAHGLDMQVVRRPEVFVGNIWDKFDADGRLTDPMAGKLIGELVGNLVELARRSGSWQAAA